MPRSHDPFQLTIEPVRLLRVITLFISRFVDLDALGFWRRLGLPSFCVLELPGYELREVVTDLTGIQDV